jgi:predicted amino acid-binding ACT domain protein
MSDVILESAPIHVSLAMLNDPDVMPTPRRHSASGGDPAREFAMLSVCGPDRAGTGIVSGMSRWIFKHSANVEAAYGTLLSDVHGAQILFSADAESMKEIQRAIDLADDVPAEVPVPPRPNADEGPPLHYQLTVFGTDREGILANVSEIFAENGILIVSYAAQTFFDSRDGNETPDREARRTGLFQLKMRVDVPRRGAAEVLERIKAELEARGSFDWAVSFEERLTAGRLRRAVCGIVGCDPSVFGEDLED